MFYIVALGNPGLQYDGTRHNVGWYMADALRTRFNFTEPIFSAQYQGKVSRGHIGDCEVVLLYPDTFMNHSGVAVKKLVPKDAVRSLIVLHDEIALPLGEQKISQGRGDGGHNGIKSIITQLGTKDFIRIRIGIAPRSWLTGTVKLISGEALPKFVLGKFTGREQKDLAAQADEVAEAVRLIIMHGVVMAMNRCNSGRD